MIGTYRNSYEKNVTEAFFSFVIFICIVDQSV